MKKDEPGNLDSLLQRLLEDAEADEAQAASGAGLSSAPAAAGRGASAAPRLRIAAATPIRAGAGQAAWGQLIQEYAGLLFAVARKTFSSYGVRPGAQDLEDAVADVWKNLLENDRKLIRQCLERSNFLQTLHVLARNRSVDIMRRRQGATVSLSETQFPVADAGPDLQQNMNAQAVREAVDQLPDREKTLVTLFFLQGRKYREITSMTGIPQNSIGPTLARALARLRKVIGDADL